MADSYEQKLLEVFQSCCTDSSGLLDCSSLSELCSKLQLDEQGPVLIEQLVKHSEKISFEKFKEALIAFLATSCATEETKKDVGADEIEEAPRLVYGSKKYGRRSRPDSSEENCPELQNETGENDVFTLSAKNGDSESTAESAARCKKQLRTSLDQDCGSNSSARRSLTSISSHGSESNPPSIGENEEEYLHAIWAKLGVGKDGYLDQTELAYVCEDIGMGKVAEKVIHQLFEQLDVDQDGRISFEEFLHLFRSAPHHGMTGTEAASFPDVSFDQRVGLQDRQCYSSIPGNECGVFSMLDPDNTGYASLDTISEFWESLGVHNPGQILRDLGFANTPAKRVNLQDLSSALEDEIQGLGELEKPPVAQAALATYKSDIQHLRTIVESVQKERDKLRLDLTEANQRALMLAHEVDDQNARLEKSSQMKIQNMEQKHIEATRQLSLEHDRVQQQTLTNVNKLQNELADLRNEETHLKSRINSLLQENQRLEQEMSSIGEELRESKKQKLAVQKEVDLLSGLKERVAELESTTDLFCEEQHQNLLKELQKLNSENKELKDRNDELSLQIEGLTTRLCISKDRSGTKRRGSSSCISTDDADIAHSPPMGKVRKYSPDVSLQGLDTEIETEIAGTEDVTDAASNCSEAVKVGDGMQVEKKPVLSTTEIVQGDQLKKILHHIRQQLVSDTWDNACPYCDKPLSSQDSDKYESNGVGDMVDIVASNRHKDDLAWLTSRVHDLESRCADLSQLQKVMEAEYEMKIHQLLEKCSLSDSNSTLENLKEQFQASSEGMKLHINLALSELDSALKREEAEREQRFHLQEKCEDMESRLQQNNGNDPDSSHMEKLEKHCQDLTSELDKVKHEIVNLLDEKEGLVQKVSRFESEGEKSNRHHGVENEETSALRSQVEQLQMEGEEMRQVHSNEKSELLERCMNYENSLELMKVEYEKCEDYWQKKLDEERDIYERERQMTDDRFHALEMKIKEYEEMFAHPEISDDSDRLSTIEERASLERQVTDLEEECYELRQQVEQSRVDHESIIHNFRSQLQTRLEQEKNALEQQMLVLQHKCVDYEQRLAALSREEESIAAIVPMPVQNPELEEEVMNLRRRCRDMEIDFETQANSHAGHVQQLEAVWAEKIEQQKQEMQDLLRKTGPQSDRNRSRSRLPGSSWSCQVDMSVLQMLNTRLRQQEQRSLHLESALKQQQQQMEKILLDNQRQHQEEVMNLEAVMKATQEMLRQQTSKYREQLEKLATSDVLVKDLYVENAMLIKKLQQTEQKLQNAHGRLLDDKLSYPPSNFA